eukprot:Rmarinus@m.17761
MFTNGMSLNAFFFSFCACFVLKIISCWTLGLFSTTYRTASNAAQTEYDSRVISTVHSIFAVYWGYLCIFELHNGGFESHYDSVFGTNDDRVFLYDDCCWVSCTRLDSMFAKSGFLRRCIDHCAPRGHHLRIPPLHSLFPTTCFFLHGNTANSRDQHALCEPPLVAPLPLIYRQCCVPRQLCSHHSPLPACPCPLWAVRNRSHRGVVPGGLGRIQCGALLDTSVLRFCHPSGCDAICAECDVVLHGLPGYGTCVRETAQRAPCEERLRRKKQRNKEKKLDVIFIRRKT